MGKYKVIEDYLVSLDIFEKIIPLSDINSYYNKNDIFIFTQMWLDIDVNSQLIQNPNFYFLNVEHLSESSRLNHIIKFLKHNITILDFSLANIFIMNNKIKELSINYTKKILYIPYLFNKKENAILQNDSNEFEYDVGIINACIQVSSSVDPTNVYRRNKMWDMIQKQKWKVINIMGWKEERDTLIKKCKIIINIHHYNCFKIFEHIRCDRLLFANKIVISDKSYFQHMLDIKDYVIWEDFDNIISKTQYILDNFDQFNCKRDMSTVIHNRREHVKKMKLLLQKKTN